MSASEDPIKTILPLFLNMKLLCVVILELLFRSLSTILYHQQKIGDTPIYLFSYSVSNLLRHPRSPFRFCTIMILSGLNKNFKPFAKYDAFCVATVS